MLFNVVFRELEEMEALKAAEEAALAEAEAVAKEALGDDFDPADLGIDDGEDEQGNDNEGFEADNEDIGSAPVTLQPNGGLNNNLGESQQAREDFAVLSKVVDDVSLGSAARRPAYGDYDDDEDEGPNFKQVFCQVRVIKS